MSDSAVLVAAEGSSSDYTTVCLTQLESTVERGVCVVTKSSQIQADRVIARSQVVHIGQG